MRKRFRYSDNQSPKELFEAVGDSEVLEIVAKDTLFDVFESTHTEGGKQLRRERLYYTVLKQKYSVFSKDVIKVYLNSCFECQLQKCKEQLKSTVTKPIRTSEFSSRCQCVTLDRRCLSTEIE